MTVEQYFLAAPIRPIDGNIYAHVVIGRIYLNTVMTSDNAVAVSSCHFVQCDLASKLPSHVVSLVRALLSSGHLPTGTLHKHPIVKKPWFDLYTECS